MNSAFIFQIPRKGRNRISAAQTLQASDINSPVLFHYSQTLSSVSHKIFITKFCHFRLWIRAFPSTTVSSQYLSSQETLGEVYFTISEKMELQTTFQSLTAVTEMVLKWSFLKQFPYLQLLIFRNCPSSQMQHLALYTDVRNGLQPTWNKEAKETKFMQQYRSFL